MDITCSPGENISTGGGKEGTLFKLDNYTWGWGVD